MSRVTIAQLQLENSQLRELCANWAHQAKADAQTIMRLKAQLPAKPATTVPSFAERAKAWCAEHNTRSVPADVVASWRHA